MSNVIEVSSLGKTWIFDIDGTIVKHNGYKIDGFDTMLPGAKEFLNSIPDTDVVIFLTARDVSYKKMTEDFLNENGIRYLTVLYGLPYGERILVNDRKPSGLNLSYAINTERNEFMKYTFEIDKDL